MLLSGLRVASGTPIHVEPVLHRGKLQRGDDLIGAAGYTGELIPIAELNLHRTGRVGVVGRMDKIKD